MLFTEEKGFFFSLHTNQATVYVCLISTAFDPDDKHSVLSATQIYQNVCVCFREDVASSSTFTLEDSAICLTSEQSTMDVDIDRDDGSVLDVYLVSWFSISDEEFSGLLIKSC